MMSQDRTAAKSLFFEGVSHMESGDFPLAEACFREAVQTAPDFAEAYANIGFLLDKRGVLDEAEACFRRSIALNPKYFEVYLNLGALLLTRKRLEEAEVTYNKAMALNPHSPAVWSNLGMVYACAKREAQAEKCYRTAMALDEKYDKARFNLSYLLLRQGRFEEGWSVFESRDWYASMTRYFACPRWRGESLLGKSILIGYEAGHGDMIQFCRYAAVLKARGASSVTLICHPALKTLFATLDAVDTLIAFDEEVPRSGWDFWTPPMSIPYYCNTRVDSVPADIPYLRARPDLAAKWELAMPARGVRVGLVWKGNPKFENDADRSIASLDLLKPLGAVPGVSLISLQKGAGEDEAIRPPEGMSITHVGSGIKSFEDTAAIVSNLDLVICVDTAVAHLAGALGKTCWVLLPEYITDWRWLSGRTDSLWYPRVMRLFRQSETGEWRTVISAVAAALEQFAQERASR